MAKWRSARLRRLYGKPTDPIETSDDASAGPESSGQTRAATEAPPPPPPKRIRREKTRPESEYELIHNMPVTQTMPDYSLLVNPLSEKQANTVAYAIHASRNNWLGGSMFETFWTRKPRGKKATDNHPNLRDKMTKLHECAVTLGPHTFPVKLFTVKDDNVHIDEEEDRKVQETLNAVAEEEKKVKLDAEQTSETKGLEDQPNATDKPEPSTLQGDQRVVLMQGEVSRDGEVNSGSTNDGSTNGDSTRDAPETQDRPDASQSHEDTEKATENAREQQSNKVLQVNALPQSAEVAGSVNSKHEEQALESKAHTPQFEPHLETTEGSQQPPTGVAPGTESVPSIVTGPKESKLKSEDNPGTPIKEEITRSPTPLSTGLDSPQRKGSFEMEKQNLEAEKRRVEELEKRLKGQDVPYHKVEAPKENDEASQATDPAGGIKPNVQAERQPSPQLPSKQQSMPVSTPSAPIPPPPHAGPPRAVPNELVVSKLQQMAARDAQLGELMRVVASQTASHEDIMKFQEIINRVKASIFTVPTPAPKAKAKAKPKAPPQLQRMQPTYPTRAHSKAIMLAIEFDENPAERHLLPKRSIIEYIPTKGQLLWSFLHVAEDDSKHAVGPDKKRRKIYTPVTATFHDIPFKVAQTLERCVRKPDIVAYYMKETMANAARSEPWNLWYRIEKNDEVLLESIKKLQAPTMAPPPPPRKPMKPRKAKVPAFNVENAKEDHARPGEPLIQSRPMIIGRRGQPMVQSPSYYQHIQRRPRGSANRATAIPSTAPPVMAASGADTRPPLSAYQPGERTHGVAPTEMPREGFAPAPLNLPDPTSFQLPPGAMPPLPRSMQ